jgi:rSAM/selenodomain-associated transferase 2
MKLSIIIPTLNEENYIVRLIKHLRQHADERLYEIIVADGSSSDRTRKLVLDEGVHILQTEQACRAHQMNRGAAVAVGDVYYFVHADVLPSPHYLDGIENALQKGYTIGGCRQRFEGGSPLLAINAWMTRFNLLYFRGGDQTLFITPEFFQQLQGFNENYCIMEDYELMRRARKQTKFAVLPCATTTSARKYLNNSWLRVQLANLKAVHQFQRNIDPRIIRDTYIKSIQY